jgi:hypothetical protein
LVKKVGFATKKHKKLKIGRTHLKLFVLLCGKKQAYLMLTVIE